MFRRSLRSTSGALGDVDWTWTEQIARRQFQLNAKVSANQFWLLVARVDFDSMLSGTCGRHYQKKNLVSIMAAVAKLPSWQDAGQYFFFHILSQVRISLCRGHGVSLWLKHRFKAENEPSVTLHNANECLVVRYLRHSCV